jgi:hypothetical protein
MTIREYSKITGLNINKVYRYSKYKSWVNSKIVDMTFEELPLCMKYSIGQVLTNLKCIQKGETHHPIDIALIKSGFKITSKPFLSNILCDPSLYSRRYMIGKVSINHVEKLISITEDFINKKSQ